MFIWELFLWREQLQMSTSLNISKSIRQVPCSILFDINDLYIVWESDRRLDLPHGSSQRNVFLGFWRVLLHSWYLFFIFLFTILLALCNILGNNFKLRRISCDNLLWPLALSSPQQKALDCMEWRACLFWVVSWVQLLLVRSFFLEHVPWDQHRFSFLAFA